MAVTEKTVAEYWPSNDAREMAVHSSKLKRNTRLINRKRSDDWQHWTSSGHPGCAQGWKVLKDLGYLEIDCVVVDLDKTREKALNVALNKISGEWDLPLLQELLGELEQSMFDVSITGFDAAEVDELFSRVHDKEVKEDDFDAEAAAKEITEPVTRHSLEL